MYKPSNCHPRKATRAASSAFLCLLRGVPGLRVSLAIALVALSVAASAHAQSPEPSKPEVQLKGVSIERVDVQKRTADTKLFISIDNPGPGFTVKDLRYRLKLNDRQAGEGTYDRAITIPDHAAATVELPCRVDLSSLPGVVWRIIAAGFDVRYELETEFSVPIFPPLNPRVKRTIGGELSLAGTVSGWTAKIKEHLSSK